MRDRNKRVIFFILLTVLLCHTGNIFASGKKEKDSPKTREVEVSGVVRMVGNSPMTSLVISGESPDGREYRDWFIAPEEEHKLAEFQQQAVTVRAMEYYYDRTFANGTSAGRQYYLKNIVIISRE